MPALRQYEVDLTFTVKVSATSIDEALDIAQKKVNEGYDTVHISNAMIRETF